MQKEAVPMGKKPNGLENQIAEEGTEVGSRRVFQVIYSRSSIHTHADSYLLELTRSEY